MNRNAVDWAVLGVSVLAIVVLAGVLVAEGLGGSRPADPTVTLHAAEARQGELGWIVPATVANAGDEAAAAVVIEATAIVDGADEVSQLEIDYLPAGTEVEIAFAFSGQPEDEISTRLVGFRVP